VVSSLGVFIILRIVRHNLLRMLEPADRDAAAHHVHRPARLGASVLISGIWYEAPVMTGMTKGVRALSVSIRRKRRSLGVDDFIGDRVVKLHQLADE
jgi:hypothetical protein